MKNLMLLITLASIMFTSCSKEEIIEPIAEQKTEPAYVFKLSNTNEWEAVITEDHLDKSTFTSARNNGNSLHAHGDFAGFGGGLISFSGTQNNGGIHGNSEIELTFGPFGSAHVELQTVSVISNGENEVIYGGQISNVIENTVMFPPPPPGFPLPPCNPYELGTYVYFVVKDNGQGNTAPADQYRGLITNQCNEIGNGGADFPWMFFGFVDVESSKDKIKVND